MKRRHVRPAFWWLLIAVILLSVAGALAPPIKRTMRHRGVEAALARFEASPSHKGADELARLLSEGIATREQGERILKTVLCPRITMRSAYPLGQLPFLFVDTPFSMRVPHTTVSWNAGLRVDGRGGNYGRSGGETFQIFPRFESLYPAPQEPGLYDAEVCCEYTVSRRRVKGKWRWAPRPDALPRSLLPRRIVTRVHPLHKAPDYTCRFSIPVRFTVVEEHEAEKIDLLSNTELDERVCKAFTMDSNNLSGTYSTPAGRRRYTGGTIIKYSVLPLAVAFKPTLRLANGEEIARRDERAEWRIWYRVRAGTSGEFFVAPPTFPVEAPGEYNATLILTPDLDSAYDDPAIKAIWDGTLELPVHFTITAGGDNMAQDKQ